MDHIARESCHTTRPALVLAGVLALWAGVTAAAGAAAVAGAPLGKLPDTARPLSYALNLIVDPLQERFSGEVRVRVRLAAAARHLWLHARDLAVDTVSVTDAGGKTTAARFAMRDPSGVAEVMFGATLPAGDIELAIHYSAPFGAQQFQGLFKVKVGDDVYAVTQMEASNARFVFPGFDEPRFKTPFDLTLTVPSGATAVANTRPVREAVSPDGASKTITYATTLPLPTYLIAFAVGPWDVVEAPPLPANAVRKSPVPLRAIGPRGTGPQLQWILGETPAMVKFYEEYTAQPYPFDKLDLLGSAGFLGAMENAGLIIFEDVLLRLDQHSSAASYRTGFNVAAHEIAHQWFGDLVTVPWWDDIWLNEAFATWAQQKETVALQPGYLGGPARVEATLSAMSNDSLLSARQIRQPIAGGDDIQNAFDSITYEKGAAVLRMFEEWLGEDTYRRAMREYLRRHAQGSGNSIDLVAAIAETSGKGAALESAMHSFLDQPGIPLVHVKLTCANGRATLAMRQSRYLPYGVVSKSALQWKVPVCARFGGHNASRQCFLLDGAQQEFAVDGACPDWVLPNAGADGYYRFSLDEPDFTALRAQVAALEPVEQLIFADAVSSAFRRGEMTPAALLDAMPALADSNLPQVATALFDDFAWIRRYLATDATRPALDAYAIKLYGARVAALGYRRRPDESDATTRLRVRLATFLAFTVRDAEVRHALAEQGRAALGLGAGGSAGAPNLSQADADLRGAMLEAAVQDLGEPAFRAALGELKTNRQSGQRRDLIAALGATHDARLGEEALDVGLAPETAVEEILPLFFSYPEEPENMAPFWRWFQMHYEALRARMPDLAQGYLPAAAGSGRCSKPESEELRLWFAPRIKDLAGGERALEQQLESIGQCAALRDHTGAAALAAWAARP